MFLHVLTPRINSLMAIGILFTPCAYSLVRICVQLCVYMPMCLIPGCILFLLRAMAQFLMYNWRKRRKQRNSLLVTDSVTYTLSVKVSCASLHHFWDFIFLNCYPLYDDGPCFTCEVHFWMCLSCVHTLSPMSCLPLYLWEAQMKVTESQ